MYNFHTYRIRIKNQLKYEFAHFKNLYNHSGLDQSSRCKKKIFFKWSDELQFSYGKKDIKSQAPLIGVLMSAYFWRFCLVTSRPVGLDPNNNKPTVISWNIFKASKGPALWFPSCFRLRTKLGDTKMSLRILCYFATILKQQRIQIEDYLLDCW